jgi:hypothetical protein
MKWNQSTQDSRHGLIRDKHGREIRPGDLLKSFHFQEAKRRQKHYLYHVVVVVWDQEKPYFRMVPTSHLEPALAHNGGSCLLTPGLASNAEIIDGCGPADHEWWSDRRKEAMA